MQAFIPTIGVAPLSVSDSDFISKRVPTRPNPERRPARRRQPTALLNDEQGLPRRDLLQLSGAALLATLLPIAPTQAAVPTAVPSLDTIETDDLHGYSFSVPSKGWTRNTASLSSFREVTVFVSDSDGDSNINMVATPVPSDFQKLTSFGTLDNVLVRSSCHSVNTQLCPDPIPSTSLLTSAFQPSAPEYSHASIPMFFVSRVQDTLVPRGRKGIEGAVLSTSVDPAKNAYVIEYTITSGGVPRHLITVFSLQPGRYLLTLTGQAKEENWAKQEPILRAITNSYSLRKFDV